MKNKKTLLIVGVGGVLAAVGIGGLAFDDEAVRNFTLAGRIYVASLFAASLTLAYAMFRLKPNGTLNDDYAIVVKNLELILAEHHAVMDGMLKEGKRVGWFPQEYGLK